MKKLISILLSVLMLAGVITAVPASAAEAGSNADYSYVISGGEVTVTGYLGKQYNVSVPEKIDGYTVTAIGTGVFAHKDASALRSVSLPASVTLLEDGAFTDLSSNFVLNYYGTKSDWDKNVHVGLNNDGFTLQRMRFLYKNTFWYCVNAWDNITITASRDLVADVIIPETIDGYTVTEISGYCFDDDWTTKTLWLPDSVKNLGYCSIGECSIEAIRIGSGLKTISVSAFENNTHLTDIYYNGNEEQWKKIEIEENGNERLKEVTMHYVQEVNTFDVTGVVEPVFGEKANFNAVDTKEYSVGNFVWYNVTDGFKLTATDTFESGKTYRAQIDLYPRWGYRFIYDNVSAKINGEKATYSSIQGVSTYNGITIKKEFACAKGFITSVEITDVVAPKAGEEPVFTFKSSPEGFTVDNNVVDWYNLTEYKKVKQGDKFEEGKKYAAYFKIYAEDGYKFAVAQDGLSAVVSTVNGNAAETQTLTDYDPETIIRIRYDFSAPTDSTEPVTTEPATDKPTEPVPTEPKPTEPKPTATEPQSTTTEPQPITTEPATDKPTEPVPTEPQPTTTEPQPTTEPETDEPEPERTDISSWKVSGIKNKTYTGKAVKQSVKVTDSGNYAEFTVTYKNNVNVGTATMKIVGIGEYKGSITKTFKITKAPQPMTAKGSTKTVKLAKVKKAKQTVKNAVTVKKAQGAVTYAKIAKGSSNKLTISKNGVITVAKGKYKKNTVLKIKVKVSAKGTKNYQSGSKNVWVKIKVK